MIKTLLALGRKTLGTPAAIPVSLWAQEEIWMSQRRFASGPQDHVKKWSVVTEVGVP